MDINIEKYFQKPNVSVEWLALIEPGIPVKDDENWMCSKKDRYPLFNGYKAARLVKNKGDKYFKVICSIYKSTLGLPLFSCRAFEYDPIAKIVLFEIKNDS